MKPDWKLRVPTSGLTEFDTVLRLDQCLRGGVAREAIHVLLVGLLRDLLGIVDRNRVGVTAALLHLDNPGRQRLAAQAQRIDLRSDPRPWLARRFCKPGRANARKHPPTLLVQDSVFTDAATIHTCFAARHAAVGRIRPTRVKSNPLVRDAAWSRAARLKRMMARLTARMAAQTPSPGDGSNSTPHVCGTAMLSSTPTST